ncbi:MAG: right-handed parallel beta-helix repeat-containing protein [Planctomycetota bacterium]
MSRDRGLLTACLFVVVAVLAAPAAPAAQQFTVQNTVELLTALNDAVDGDTVELLGGDYVLTDSLRPNTGVTLAGAGAGATRLIYQGTGTNPDQRVIDLDQRDRVTVTGLTVDGENRTAGGAAFGIYAAQGSGHVIDGVTVTQLAGDGFGPIGVYFNGGVDDAVVRNSTVTDIGVPVPASDGTPAYAGSTFGSGIRVFGDSDNVLIEHNTVDGTGRGGIFARGRNDDDPVGPTLDGLVVRRNEVRNSALVVGTSGAADLGIELQNDIIDAVVEYNKIDRRVSLDGVVGAAVRNNTVTQTINNPNAPTPASFGLELVDSENVVFRGNTVDATADVDFGVSVSGNGDTRYAVFEQNTIDGADVFGAQIQGDDPGGDDGVVERVYFSRNLITDTTAGQMGTGDSIRLNEAFDDITLDANQLGAREGVDVFAANPPTGAEVTLSGNTRPPDDASLGALVTVPGGDPFVVADPLLLREVFIFAVGEAVSITFDQLDDLKQVLWDLGEGVPVVTTTGALPGSASAGLTVGQELLAVGWSTTGEADSVLVRIVPEPSAALALTAAAGLTLSRRSSRRSRPSPSSL